MSDRISPNNYPWKINGNPWTNKIKNLYQEYPSDLLFQIVFAFAIGLVFAPWSWGLLYLILFFIFFEIGYAIIHRDFCRDHMITRLVIILASFIGWLIGRAAIQDKQPFRWKYKDEYYHVGCPDYQPKLKKKENYQSDDFLSEAIYQAEEDELPMMNERDLNKLIDSILFDD